MEKSWLIYIQISITLVRDVLIIIVRRQRELSKKSMAYSINLIRKEMKNKTKIVLNSSMMAMIKSRKVTNNIVIMMNSNKKNRFQQSQKGKRGWIYNHKASNQTETRRRNRRRAQLKRSKCPYNNRNITNKMKKFFFLFIKLYKSFR